MATSNKNVYNRPYAFVDAITPKLVSMGFEVLSGEHKTRQAKTKKSVTFEIVGSPEIIGTHETLLTRAQFDITVRAVGNPGAVSVTTKSNALSPDVAFGGSLINQASTAYRAEITKSGALGTSEVRFSCDNLNWSTPQLTAASLTVPNTGLVYVHSVVAGTSITCAFTAGNYTVGDVYTANYVRKTRDQDAVWFAMGQVLKACRRATGDIRASSLTTSDESGSGISDGSLLIMRCEFDVLMDLSAEGEYVNVTDVTLTGVTAT